MRTPSIQHARNYEAPADVERASMLHLAIFLIGSTAADVCVDFSERSGLRLDDDSERFVHSGWKDWRKAQRYYANGSVAVVPVGENEFKALERVPEDFRTVVLLSDVEGFSYKEVADMCDIPVGTVMSRLFRGRRILQDLLFSYAVDVGVLRPKMDSTTETPLSLADYRKRRARA